MAKTMPPASDTARQARRVKVRMCATGGARWSCGPCYEFGWAHRFDIALADAFRHASSNWHAIATRPRP